MKTLPALLTLAGAAFLFVVSRAEARPYGVSSESFGRGTAYHTSRGGEAYVGPRGFAAQGAEGRTAVSTPRFGAYSGPNVDAYAGRYRAGAVTANGAAYTRYGGAGYVARPAPLPGTYIRTVPAGATTVVYHGVSCYYVGGVYYQPVFYGGTTVYVVVP
jgi:hypothetical protein